MRRGVSSFMKDNNLTEQDMDFMARFVKERCTEVTSLRYYNWKYLNVRTIQYIYDLYQKELQK